MTKQKTINWIRYNGTIKPEFGLGETDEKISDGRWAAMVEQILKEFPELDE
jgi:hypothetical protein